MHIQGSKERIPPGSDDFHIMQRPEDREYYGRSLQPCTLSLRKSSSELHTGLTWELSHLMVACEPDGQLSTLLAVASVMQGVSMVKAKILGGCTLRPHSQLSRND